MKKPGLLTTAPLAWAYFVSFLAGDKFIAQFNIWKMLKESGEVPNSLTQIRLALSPLPFLLMALGPTNVILLWCAFAAFVLIMLTDALDGHWARAWNQKSDYGTVWDPAADKAITFLTMLGLCLFGLFPAPFGAESWFGWAYLIYTAVREIGILFVRGKFVISANWVGKWKTILLSIAFPMMLVPIAASFPTTAQWWNGAIVALLLGSFVCSFVSGVQYYAINLRMRRETKEVAAL